MPTFRGYVNKRDGNEHSRMIDVEADDIAAAQAAIEKAAKKTEVVEQVVHLPDMTPGAAWAPDAAAQEAMAQQIASELAAKMGLDEGETLALARAAVQKAGPLS